MPKKKTESCYKAVKNHLERTSKVVWEQKLEDPRSNINKILDFNYVMQTFFIGILSGKENLRRIEDLSETFGNRVSDTTFHDLITNINPAPLRELLVKEVKSALHDHELPKEEFPIRLTAIDGKCISVSSKSVGEFSQKSECNGKVQYVNRALRAFHVSNKTILCLGQHEIKGKSAETSEFKPFIETLIADYGKTSLLEVISVDAGMTSKANADFLRESGLHYIMGLKGPQVNLLSNAKTLLDSASMPNKTSEETANGYKVVRELFRCEVPSELQHGWTHLKEIWKIRQTSTHKASKKVVVEDRYFLSSLPPSKLNHSEAMTAIRMHWHIENNGNWITDTAFNEDNSPFANAALILVSLMRMFCFNILSRLKTRKLRSQNIRQTTWKTVMLLIERCADSLIDLIDTQEELIALP